MAEKEAVLRALVSAQIPAFADMTSTRQCHTLSVFRYATGASADLLLQALDSDKTPSEIAFQVLHRLHERTGADDPLREDALNNLLYTVLSTIPRAPGPCTPACGHPPVPACSTPAAMRLTRNRVLRDHLQAVADAMATASIPGNCDAVSIDDPKLAHAWKLIERIWASPRRAAFQAALLKKRDLGRALNAIAQTIPAKRKKPAALSATTLRAALNRCLRDISAVEGNGLRDALSLAAQRRRLVEVMSSGRSSIYPRSRIAPADLPPSMAAGTAADSAVRAWERPAILAPARHVTHQRSRSPDAAQRNPGLFACSMQAPAPAPAWASATAPAPHAFKPPTAAMSLDDAPLRSREWRSRDGTSLRDTPTATMPSTLPEPPSGPATRWNEAVTRPPSPVDTALLAIDPIVHALQVLLGEQQDFSDQYFPDGEPPLPFDPPDMPDMLA